MQHIKYVMQKISILLGLNIMYFIFLSGCFLLPTTPIVKNIEKSLDIWVDAQEGADTPVFDKTNTLYWDSYSDMIWANMASVSGSNPIEQAIKLEYYSGNDAPWNNLVGAVYYRDSAPKQNYSRYWNINVGVLKILFSFLPLSDIRFLIYWIVSGLVFFLIYRISKLQGVSGCIPIIVSFMMTLLELHAICLSFIGDIFITLVFMILLTYVCPSDTKKERQRIHLLFMIMGSMIFAAGPLVAPVLSVGMCLVLWIQLENRDTDKNILWRQTVLNTVWWIVGYGSTMLLKQLLSKIVTGKEDGTENALMWFGAEMGIQERLHVLGEKLIRCFTPMKVKLPIFLLFIAILIFLCIRYYCKSNKTMLLAFVAVYPVLWVIIISRHSIHSFTSNIFAVLFYALISNLINHISFNT